MLSYIISLLYYININNEDDKDKNMKILKSYEDFRINRRIL